MDLSVIYVHGIGHHEVDPQWWEPWHKIVQPQLKRWNPAINVIPSALAYDDLFAAQDITAMDCAEALVRLGSSWIWHGIGDLFRRRRGLFETPEVVRWTAGMVVEWISNEKLQLDCRQRLYTLARQSPGGHSLIVAHSLGSLIAYDALSEIEKPKIGTADLVTLGSQIGHPSVRRTFGSLIKFPAGLGRWFNLYNERDWVFTSALRLSASGFKQVATEFTDKRANHSAEYYLNHGATEDMWHRLAAAPRAGVLAEARNLGVSPLQSAMVRGWRGSKPKDKPVRRALLIGINEYPNPSDRLEGCVNDVYSMSATLQDTGFSADEIRVVLDGRATAKGIRERMEWLLEGASAGDVRFLYYSGHGAQIPSSDLTGEVDKLNECLVPYDFDWSEEKAIIDNQIYDLYAQLPYDTHFVMFLDCCHARGIERGAISGVRGLNPPDDIRHRMLKWNSHAEMWETRRLPPVIPDKLGEKERLYFGNSGVQYRLGVAASLRSLTSKEYDLARERKGHQGPYMPIIITACEEDEYAYEYKHGVTPHGAFTYALTNTLRRLQRQKRAVTFRQLVAKTREIIIKLGYKQRPTITGPTARLDERIPTSASS